MRVLAINDVSCVGKCSLTVSLPIISACGIECNVLPTALLSTHTGGFKDYTFLDLTGEIPDILRHWKSLGLTFDYICSGYLGSIDQIELVRQIKKEFLADGGVFIVDPVMGDGGKLYSGFTPAFLEKMKSLCKEADYILPNMTEACYLSDTPYPLTNESAISAFARLQALCPRPVLTGVVDNNEISVCYADENGQPVFYTHENVQGFFHGAGDVFASAFVGALARGKSQAKAIQLASDFSVACIRRTDVEVPDKRYGLNFEAELFSFLKNLNA